VQSRVTKNYKPDILINPLTYYDFAAGELGKAVESFIQTTNATVTTLATITPEADAAGFLEVTVFAFIDNGTKSITGKKFVHWKMISSLVTIIALTNDAADSLDGLTTATWTVDASGATLRIRVTGEAATNLDWYSYHQLQFINTTPQ